MMISRATRLRHRRRGAVAVLVAICLVPLIGVLALALEGGMMLAARRRAQTVADASAYAAACQLYKQSSTDPSGLDLSGKARAAALANAKANDFNNDGKTNKVDINLPPSSQGSFWENKPGCVEVITTSYQTRSFSAIFGSGTMTIAARAVARISLSSPQLVVLLDSKNTSQAFYMTGGSTINSEAAIQVNSSSGTGTYLINSSHVNTPVPQLHGGGVRDTSSGVNGKVQVGVDVVPDPLASLASPTTIGQPNQSFTSQRTNSPGVYNGGLSIANGKNVTLQPGVYYMKGGPFRISGAANVSGDGVTIFVDYTGGGNGKISISNGVNAQTHSPHDRNLRGVGLFS